MKTSLRAAGVGLSVLLLGSLWCVAAESPAKSSSTRPPKNLKKIGDHWTAWEPPPAVGGSYVTQRGDTLWDLAGKWLGDPHLWPQVWDQNRYVLDSHWIYPGDPLSVPGKPNVVPPEGPVSATPTQPQTGTPSGSDETAAASGAAETAPVASAVPALIRLADQRDLYCSGWVENHRHASMLTIQAAESEKQLQGSGDLLYLNQGRSQGIAPGAEYLVVRPDHDVVHPATSELLGTYVRRMGHVRVLCAQENTATAVVLNACEDLRSGDELVPWQEMPSPALERIPPVDRCEAPSGLAQGWIVDGGADRQSTVGAGNVVATDLGSAAGVRPGTLLTLFRDNGDYPRLVLGQAVVLTVEGETSTVKLLHVSREVHPGDRAEVFQQ